jgi:HPt (histidine-containing phosphotransfer) domain-containing protein
MDAIWARRRPQVLERVAEVERAAAAVAAGDCEEPEVIEAGRAAAHRLAGSLGMFGSAAGSSCASQLEEVLAPGADAALVLRLAADLRAAIPPSVGRGPEPGPAAAQ